FPRIRKRPYIHFSKFSRRIQDRLMTCLLAFISVYPRIMEGFLSNFGLKSSTSQISSLPSTLPALTFPLLPLHLFPSPCREERIRANISPDFGQLLLDISAYPVIESLSK
ncbi:MAG TPA: hypothetical protein VLN47_03995, partial [Clostridiaceae bacterium]|nr:hypothetical protein [Clostridiaceae bacterium]